MDEPIDPEVQRIFDAKLERRRRLAALPIHEKVKILIRLQRMTVPLLQGRDPRARVWQIPEGDEPLESEISPEQ